MNCLYMSLCQVSCLVTRTSLEESVIRSQYSSFMLVCPDGGITKSKFLEHSEVSGIQMCVNVLGGNSRTKMEPEGGITRTRQSMMRHILDLP